jgi:hypothetical protein
VAAHTGNLAAEPDNGPEGAIAVHA